MTIKCHAVMSRKDEIENLFREVVQGKPYNGKPIPVNRFSVSGLSFSADQEVKRKLGLVEETFRDRLNMLRGTALHSYVQSMVKNQGYVAEYRMYFTIPFRWHYMGYENINLVGVIDLLHNDRREILELKSSTSSDRIEDYHRLQLASYMKMMSERTGQDYSGYVVKFGGTDLVTEEIPKEEVQHYWETLVSRAMECARRIDQAMEENDVKQMTDPNNNRGNGLYGFEPH
jgi:hypothetical protein